MLHASIVKAFDLIHAGEFTVDEFFQTVIRGLNFDMCISFTYFRT